MTDPVKDFTEVNRSAIDSMPQHFHLRTFLDCDSDGLKSSELFKSDSGDLNLVYTNKNQENIPLHDVENPKKEAVEFLDIIHENSTDVIFVVGFGLGYGAIAISVNRLQCSKIIIIEPNSEVFTFALKYVDLSPLIRNHKVFFVVGDETKNLIENITDNTTELIVERPFVITHSPSMLCNTEKFDEIYNLLYDYLAKFHYSTSTRRTLGDKVYANRINNMHHFNSSTDIESLRDFYLGFPAIIIAGGPSLTKEILRSIREIQDKVVIIAVESVYDLLLKEGIIPHYLTTCEPRTANFFQYSNPAFIANQPAIIHTLSSTNETIGSIPFTRRYTVFLAGNFDKVMHRRIVGGHVEYAGTSTKAHINLIAANIFGCNPIVFVGQDLAYPDMQFYAPDFFLTPGVEFASIVENHAIAVRDVYGNPVCSTPEFDSYRKIFELLIDQNPTSDYINSSAGGADIIGAPFIEFDEVVRTYISDREQCVTQRYEKSISLTSYMSYQKSSSKFLNLRRAINSIISINDDLFDLILSVESYVSSLNENDKMKIKGFGGFPGHIQKKFKQAMKFYATLQRTENRDLLMCVLDLSMGFMSENIRLQSLVKRYENKADCFFNWFQQIFIWLKFYTVETRKLLVRLREDISEVTMYLEKETKLKILLQKDQKNIRVNFLSLIDHYLSIRDFTSLKTLIDAHQDIDLGEHRNYYNWLFHYNRFASNLANHYFEQISDVSLKEYAQIEMNRMGDLFLSMAQEEAESIPSVGLKCAKDGIKYCPGHDGLHQFIDYLNEKI